MFNYLPPVGMNPLYNIHLQPPRLPETTTTTTTSLLAPQSTQLPSHTIMRPHRRLNESSPLRNQLTRPASLESTSWTCCKCQSINPFTIQSGQHPLGTLSCDCPHKPCESCIFKGVSHFLPIIEPGVVPVPSSATKTEIPFGVVCSECGLSWRVEEKDVGVNRGMSRRVPIVRDALYSLQKHGFVPRADRLRKTRSLVALRRGEGSVSTPNLHAGNEEVGKGDQKRAFFSTVIFSGLACECGGVSDLNSFCFRVVLPRRSSSVPDSQRASSRSLEETASELKKEGEEEEEKKEQKFGVGRKTDEELRKKGHDDNTIRLFGGEHPNPLRSALVEEIPVVESF